MIVKMKKIFLFSLTVVILIQPVYSKTKTRVIPNPLFPNVKFAEGAENEFSRRFQKNIDKNSPYFSNAFYEVNGFGYMVGQPVIPESEYELGLATGAGISYMPKGKYPAVSPVSAVHFGLGMGRGYDFLLKLMMFDSFVFGPEKKIGSITVKKFQQFAFGGKLRYNCLKEKKFIPNIISFKGVTIGFGMDILTGNLNFSGNYKLKMKNSMIDPGDGTPTGVDTTLSGDYDAQYKWYMVSPSVQVLSFLELFRIFTLYGGFTMTAGYGWFGLSADSVGKVMASNDSLDSRIGGGFNYKKDKLFDMDFSADSMVHPYPLLPQLILGEETSLGSAKIGFETAVNLLNRKDVVVLIGARYQF